MRKIIISYIIICIISLMVSTVYAFDLSSVIKGANDFIVSAIGAADTSGDINDSFSPLIKGLAQAGLAIGTIIAIVTGIVIAIKFMANGVEGKAEMKQELTPYLIGCVLLFSSFAIWTITVNIFNGTFDISGASPGGSTLAVVPSVVPVSPGEPIIATKDEVQNELNESIKYKYTIKDDGVIEYTSRDAYEDGTISTNKVEEEAFRNAGLGDEYDKILEVMRKNGYEKVSGEDRFIKK